MDAVVVLVHEVNVAGLGVGGVALGEAEAALDFGHGGISRDGGAHADVGGGELSRGDGRGDIAIGGSSGRGGSRSGRGGGLRGTEERQGRERGEEGEGAERFHGE